MLNPCYATTQLEPCVVEDDHAGGYWVRIRRNETQETDSEGGTQYRYDEVLFWTDQPLTPEEANTDDWWSYGESYDPDEPEPTITDRVNSLEEMVMIMMMGGDM